MLRRRTYPTYIEPRYNLVKTTLNGLHIIELDVDDRGNVLNAPPFDGGDYIVKTSRKGDLQCLLKPFPPEVLRDLACNRVTTYDGNRIVAPRNNRDDFLSVQQKGARRKTCFYGAKSLLNKANPTDSDIEDFIEDFYLQTLCRPNIGEMARRMMYIDGPALTLVREEGVPKNVAWIFNEYAPGANVDVSVLGTKSTGELKVDQDAAYVSALETLDSPVENVLRGIVWKNEMPQSDDAYGICCIDGEVDPTLKHSPVWVFRDGASYPVVGPFHEVVLLKPQLDDLRMLEREGKAKITKIHWAWRFKGLGRRIFERVCRKQRELRAGAGPSENYWKLVGCALYGLFLQQHLKCTNGKSELVGGVWFNPIIAYTVIAVMKSVNFRMKMRADGLISSELVDQVTGPVGGWYEGEKVKLKGPYNYTHLHLLHHVAPEDDKLGLLKLLQATRGNKLVRKVPSRTGLHVFTHRRGEAARDVFGNAVTSEHIIIPGNPKRKMDAGEEHFELKDLLTEKFDLMPYTEEELHQSRLGRVDHETILTEMGTSLPLLEELLLEEESEND